MNEIHGGSISKVGILIDSEVKNTELVANKFIGSFENQVDDNGENTSVKTTE